MEEKISEDVKAKTGCSARASFDVSAETLQALVLYLYAGEVSAPTDVLVEMVRSVRACCHFLMEYRSNAHLNAHSNITKYLTRASRSNTGTTCREGRFGSSLRSTGSRSSSNRHTKKCCRNTHCNEETRTSRE